jgi:hypothetical protein
MGNLSWVTCQTRLPDLFVRSADCLWSWITSSGCSMAPGFAWPADCSCKYTEDNSRILQDILNIWSRRILVALKEKTLNSTRNTPWSISFCLFMPWTWHHSQKKKKHIPFKGKTPRFQPGKPLYTGCPGTSICPQGSSWFSPPVYS